MRWLHRLQRHLTFLAATRIEALFVARLLPLPGRLPRGAWIPFVAPVLHIPGEFLRALQGKLRSDDGRDQIAESGHAFQEGGEGRKTGDDDGEAEFDGDCEESVSIKPLSGSRIM